MVVVGHLVGHLAVDPVVAGLVIGLFHLVAGWVHRIDVEVVLQAVEGAHHELRVVAGIGDVGDVVVGGNGHSQLPKAGSLDIVGHHAHHRVFLAGHRILVVVAARVELIVVVGTASALVQGHRVHGHLALVESQESQRTAVGRPGHGVQDAEFLLIHPVGHAVDHVVFHPVGCHSGRLAVVQVLDIDVVVFHIGHTPRIGREGGNFLAASIRELAEPLSLGVVHIVVGAERVAVDHVHVFPQQYLALVGTHLVAFPGSRALAGKRLWLEHGRRPLAGGVVEFEYLGAVGTLLVVVAAVEGRLRGRDSTGAALREHKVGQVKRLCVAQRCACSRQGDNE